MARRFRNMNELVSDYENRIQNLREQGTSIITEELLKDSNKEGYAPKMEGYLINSSLQYSDFKKGKIVYKTPYVRTVFYKGNRSGKLRWIDVARAQNDNKYRNILKNIWDG